MRRCRRAVLAALALAVIGVVTSAQRTDVFLESRDHPAIAYSTGPESNAVTVLNGALRSGRAALTFDGASGYLRSVLDALSVPIESQVLVYSQTSFQANRISRANPRAIYFNDRVAVGFVRGGEILEVAAQDAAQGTIFYTLSQARGQKPVFTRDDKCLSCHLSWDTRGVPGPLVLTVFPRRSDNEYANGSAIDHRAPISERWGGWYVTGGRVPESMGNMELLQPRMPPTGARPVPAPTSLKGAFSPEGFPTLFSDVAALMVLEHQALATNLIARAGWEHRIGSPHVGVAVEELVDYLLFADEAPLPHPVKGSSGFAEKFASLGPRDSKGRSLRELDLNTRLMRYPLSYMIYGPAFSGLPAEVRTAVMNRIDAVLSGKDARQKYAHLSLATRVAIQDILRDTATRSRPAL